MWTWLLDQMLRRLMHKGALEIHLPDGRTRRYGESGGSPVVVRLSDPALPRKLVRNADLAVGEAYMDGRLTIDGDDLYGFLRLAIANVASADEVWWRKLLTRLHTLRRGFDQWNALGRARANVAHHYDLSGRLYELFLDDDRQYSCGYFRTPEDTLEQAQAQKKALIARKLLLKPGMRVLDIGCGWGGMGLMLARDHGCEVLGVTLSEAQCKVANERARAEGLSDRVRFELRDYRKVKGQFDRIVSVGMFEHVGVPYYRAFFADVRKLLSEDGVALLHTIGRVSPPGSTSPWVKKYIFPGGYSPAMSEVLAAIEKERLWVTDVDVWRLHYAKTLKIWQQRFQANIDEVRALYDERFCRMWRYYLTAAELTFREDDQEVFQFQLTRRQDAVPLTRDYMLERPEDTLEVPSMTKQMVSATG